MNRWPTVAATGRDVMALRWRTIGILLAASLASIVLGEVFKAAAYPRGDLADHLERAYGSDLHSDRRPLLVAAELEREWPAEDQRYTAAGVFLRYEHDIVGLVPDGDGGTAVTRYAEEAGYRRYYTYVGDFWGPRYRQASDVERSAMAVPDDRDVRAVVRRLRAAQRVQRICFGWDIEIRSGAREGRLRGPLVPDGCASVKLTGWIDPNAGKLQKGADGDWSLGYEWTVAGTIADASVDAIDMRLGELIEGHTQEPNGEGTRPGKGLIELIESLPLLAQDLDGVPPVPVATATVPPGARPAPVQRTDSERRAEESWVGLAHAILVVGGAFVLLFVFGAAALGVLVRAARRLRGTTT